MRNRLLDLERAVSMKRRPRPKSRTRPAPRATAQRIHRPVRTSSSGDGASVYGMALPDLVPMLSVAPGDGSPFWSEALEQGWEQFNRLQKNVTKATNPNVIAAKRIKKETGIKVDDNPYFGVTKMELEAVIRASYTSHQLPEVLLALWAKEGSTTSYTDYQSTHGTTAANAKALFRSEAYYLDLGADHFIHYQQTTGDNTATFGDATAADHQQAFQDNINDLVKKRLLPSGIDTDIDNELTTKKETNGTYSVRPNAKFYALSLLLSDAYFTELQQHSFTVNKRTLSDFSPALNYLNWNMGPTKFKTFLKSADGHRKEKAFLVKGNPISIEEWALRTVPKGNEWKQARVNAVKFRHYIESYRPLFSLWMNLITPGIEDLNLSNMG